MAIAGIDPSNWENANVVQIDSDAADNQQAVDEIEDWAADHRFARVNEYWLRPIVRQDGRRVFRGVCYRLTQEEVHSSEISCEENAAALHRMPATSHQIDSTR